MASFSETSKRRGSESRRVLILRRDSGAAAAAVTMVVLVAAIVEGNVALLVLPVTATAAAACVRTGWPGGIAVAVSVAVVRAYTRQLARWLICDGAAPKDHESTGRVDHAWPVRRGRRFRRDRVRPPESDLKALLTREVGATWPASTE